MSGPKVGKVDPKNTPHVGGNTWAGGTGGRDTAGLGGRGGPYRLDAGHSIHQVEIFNVYFLVISLHMDDCRFRTKIKQRFQKRFNEQPEKWVKKLIKSA